MPLNVYKPNAKNSGGACSFSFNSKQQALFIEFIKQTGWNNESKTGLFKGGARANVKFSLAEAGGILHALEKGKEFKAYHTTKTGITQVNFGTYKKDDAVAGFFFGVKRQNKEEGVEEKFLVPLSFAEARMLAEYIKFFFEHSFSAIYSEDKKAFEVRQQKIKESPQVTPELVNEGDDNEDLNSEEDDEDIIF